MRVLNYLELEDRLERSGIGTSTAHQRAALADTDHVVETAPWTGGSPVSAAGRRLLGDPCIREYDLAHCNVIGPGSVAVARHARRNDIPLVLHAHVTAEDFAESFRFSSRATGPLRRYLRWFYSQADLVLVPSEYTRSNIETYPVDAPIRQITNGVDAARLEGHESLREPYRDRYDIEGMSVFTVGSVFERKGLTTFCDLARATDYDFTWFGHVDSGPHASPVVTEQVAEAPPNATFTGWVEDIRGGYGAGDVFLLPTKDENQGIVVLEAMSCGKAVVLSDIPVFREFYTDGEDCLMCSSLEEYVDALDRLAANPQLRERLGENAKETAAEHSLERVGRELDDAYRSVAAAGGRAD
jgi:1,2-diacylglycerol-3-alpha-glucose alpha-1,2-glucosyltransferase